jgi:hypothetical protein
MPKVRMKMKMDAMSRGRRKRRMGDDGLVAEGVMFGLVSPSV